ncbi:MAG: tetratricopeptide repeat-containing sensor histidine kinase [Ignavibacteriales bacterium]|nr:tetratricopeptide repeat-containing sensor histidine kinase [Ignavibacteriales bacterium]
MQRFFYSIIIAVLINTVILPQDSLTIAIQKLDENKQIEKFSALCFEKRSSDPQNALRYGFLALSVINKTGSQKSKGLLFDYIGIIYGNLGRLDSSFYYLQQANAIAKNSGNMEELGYNLNNFGEYYFKNALYSTALEKLIQAYHIFEELKNSRGMAYSLNDMGETYLALNDFKKALDYFEQSAKLRLSISDMTGYARSVINTASALDKMGKLDEAHAMYTKALKICTEISFIRGTSNCYAGLSDLFLEYGNFAKALEYRQKSLEIDVKISNKFGEIVGYIAMGNLYLNLPDLGKAGIYLSLAEEEARNTGLQNQLVNVYKIQRNLQLKKQDYKLAADYDKKYEDLKEKIFGYDAENRVTELQTAFATERKDRENELLKKDIEYQKNTRNYFLLIIFLIFGGAGLFASKYKLQKKTTNLLTELNASKDKFFSIIAHDLKNPVGAIYNYADILESDYDTLTDAERKHFISGVFKSSKQILDMLLDLLTWARSQKGEINLNKTRVNLNSLVAASVDSYSLVAENKNIAVELNIEGTIDVLADKFILQTIIGNLINNALKFSYPGSKVIINCSVNNGMAEISVKDFGIGMEQQVVENLFNVEFKHSSLGTNKEKGTGLGLKICKEFAELHGGSLHVESKIKEGSVFTFSFNME